MHPFNLTSIFNRGMDCFVILVVFFICRVETDNKMNRLYKHILKSYEKDIRPAMNHSMPLNITFGFSLTQIIDVDEKNQILTTNAWINQMWLDYKLRWNASEFSNISMIHIPYHRIWRPDIVLYNNADSHYNTAIMSTDVFVTSDGNVTWLSAAIFKSSCQMNVRYYPFDEQDCEMKFASWAYDGTLIDLVLVSEQGDDSNYMKSTEWDLIFIGAKRNLNFFSCCEEPFPDIVITIKIRRRPMFYVFNLILPCVLITGIALLGFYMPSDSGEKVTLGITTLLSMTVFLMLVAESMPPTSDTLPLIGMYYGVTICLVSFATAMTVFTLNIHHKGLRGNPVPKSVKTCVFGVLAKILRIKLDPPEGLDSQYKDYDSAIGGEREPLNSATVPMMDSSFHNGGVSPLLTKRVRGGYGPASSGASASCTGREDFETQFLRVLNKVYATIEKNEMRLAEQDRRDVIKLEWQQVALVVDRFLLLCFVIVTTSVSLLIIYQRQLSFG